MTKNFKCKKGTTKPIWDGDDSGISDHQYDLKCGSCGSDQQYFVRDGIKLRNVKNTALIEYLLTHKIVTQEGKDGFTDYYVKKQYPAYVVDIACTSCGEKNYVVLGMKEVQPQRYVIYEGGVLSNSSSH
jgi:Zn finger protein HypA/HybF involved in hydrogenase expression